MIDILLRSIEKLPDIAVDLAYFTGAAVDKLIDGLSPYIQHRYHCHKAHRDKGDQYKGKDKLVFYFHYDNHHPRKWGANGQTTRANSDLPPNLDQMTRYNIRRFFVYKNIKHCTNR
ncbi:hypothetical protein [Pseudomonas gingeri]|uniref:hypothetical protein n=1 Tax=Pseudomonas gingeri TaxID=117681 RepID=UPI00210B5EE7|nr:hypothetical protein [Pseudomonas gingeri]